MIPVIALDVSLRATGYACTTTDRHGHDTRRHGLITPPKGLRGGARLDNLARQIARHIHASEARLVTIENYAFGASSRAVTVLAELGGCIRRDLHRLGVPHLAIASNTAKMYAVGNGRADKDQMVAAAQDQLGYRGRDDNVADAIWLLALTMDALGQGFAPDLPSPSLRAKRRQAVATVVPLLPRTGVL